MIIDIHPEQPKPPRIGDLEPSQAFMHQGGAYMVVDPDGYCEPYSDPSFSVWAVGLGDGILEPFQPGTVITPHPTAKVTL